MTTSKKPTGPCAEHGSRPEFGCDPCIRYVRHLEAEAQRQAEVDDAPTQRIEVEWSASMPLHGTVTYEAPIPAGWTADQVWDFYEAELYDLINEAADDAIDDHRGDFLDWDAHHTTIGPIVERSPKRPDPNQPNLLDAS